MSDGSTYQHGAPDPATTQNPDEPASEAPAPAAPEPQFEARDDA